jgi:putative endonuclease
MYYLYLIESETSGRYYIGQTDDLPRRLNDHNGNRKRFTTGKGPWCLIGYRPFRTRSEAVLEERRLKRAKNRKYIYYYFERKAQDIPT